MPKKVFLIFAWILFASVSISEQVEKLTNIDFLGKGYNIIEANPHGAVQEQGFGEGVIDLTYKSNKLTADGKWQLPDDTEAIQMNVCEYLNIQGRSSGARVGSKDWTWKSH